MSKFKPIHDRPLLDSEIKAIRGAFMGVDNPVDECDPQAVAMLIHLALVTSDPFRHLLYMALKRIDALQAALEVKLES